MAADKSKNTDEMDQLSSKFRHGDGQDVSKRSAISYIELMPTTPLTDNQSQPPELTPDCREAIDAVLDMEDLFSKLSFNVDSVALQPRNKDGASTKEAGHENQQLGDNGKTQNCLIGLHNSWRYVQSLAVCSQVHLENAAEYHQFWHTVKESTEWLSHHMDNLPSLFQTHSLKFGTTYEIKQTISSIMDTLKEFLQCQTRLDVLYEKSQTICPVNFRREPLPYDMNVRILADYTVDQVELKQGDTVVLVDNADSKKWKIRVKDQELFIPAILVMITPTSAEAVDSAGRLRNQMLALWSAASQCLSQHVTKLLSFVFGKVSSQNSVYQYLNDNQLKELGALFEDIKEQLGSNMKNTIAFKHLSDQCKKILETLSKPTDSQSRGLLIQVTILRRLMQRYRDFCVYHQSYRDCLAQAQSARQIFICTEDTEFKYITAAHYIRSMDIDLENMKNGEFEEVEETIVSEESEVMASAPDANNDNIDGDEGEEEYFFEESEVTQTEDAVETTVVITGVVKEAGTPQEEVISLQDAIDAGLVDFSTGVYKLDADEIPIHQAMSDGLIKTSVI